MKIVIETMFKCSSKYLASLFYKGQILWNNLAEVTQRLTTIVLFAKEIRPLYCKYEDLLR